MSLHLGGELLHSYTTQDLVKMGARTAPSFKEVDRTRALFRVVGCEQVPQTNEYGFVIDLGDSKRVSLDIPTGRPRREAPAGK